MFCVMDLTFLSVSFDEAIHVRCVPFYKKSSIFHHKEKNVISFGTPGEKVLLNPSQIYWILGKVLSFISLFRSKAFCTQPNSF